MDCRESNTVRGSLRAFVGNTRQCSSGVASPYTSPCKCARECVRARVHVSSCEECWWNIFVTGSEQLEDTSLAIASHSNLGYVKVNDERRRNMDASQPQPTGFDDKLALIVGFLSLAIVAYRIIYIMIPQLRIGYQDGNWPQIMNALTLLV